MGLAALNAPSKMAAAATFREFRLYYTVPTNLVKGQPVAHKFRQRRRYSWPDDIQFSILVKMSAPCWRVLQVHLGRHPRFVGPQGLP